MNVNKGSSSSSGSYATQTSPTRKKKKKTAGEVDSSSRAPIAGPPPLPANFSPPPGYVRPPQEPLPGALPGGTATAGGSSSSTAGRMPVNADTRSFMNKMLRDEAGRKNKQKVDEVVERNAREVYNTAVSIRDDTGGALKSAVRNRDSKQQPTPPDSASPPLFVVHQATSSALGTLPGGTDGAPPNQVSVAGPGIGAGRTRKRDIRTSSKGVAIDNANPNFSTFNVGAQGNAAASRQPPPALPAGYSSGGGYSSSDNEYLGEAAVKGDRMSGFVSSDGGFTTDGSLSPQASKGRKVAAMLLSASPPRSSSAGKKKNKTTAWASSGESSDEHADAQHHAAKKQDGTDSQKPSRGLRFFESLSLGASTKLKRRSTSSDEDENDRAGTGSSKQSGVTFDPQVTGGGHHGALGSSKRTIWKAMGVSDWALATRRKTPSPDRLKGRQWCCFWLCFRFRECAQDCWRCFSTPVREIGSDFFHTVFDGVERRWQRFEEKYLISFEELDEDSDADDEVFDTGASSMHLARDPFSSKNTQGRRRSRSNSKDSLDSGRRRSSSGGARERRGSSGGERRSSRSKEGVPGSKYRADGRRGSADSQNSSFRTDSKDSWMDKTRRASRSLIEVVPIQTPSWIEKRKEAARQRRKQRLLEEGHRKPEDVATELILKYKDIDMTLEEDKNQPALPPDSLAFNGIMGFFIICNTVFLMLQTDLNVKECDSQGVCCKRIETGPCKGQGEVTSVKPVPALEGEWYWYAADVGFLLIFMAELRFRWAFHRRKLFLDPYAVFDGFIVTLGCIDTFILTLAAPESGGTLRALTVLRTARLVKLGRILRHFPAMRTLVKMGEALRGAAPAVLTVMALFLMLIYFFGIVFTVTVGKKRELYAPYAKVSGWNWRDYFGSCGTTMQTLIVLATKSEWSTNIVRPVVDNQPSMICIWVFFIMITWYGLLNIIVSVIVAETLKLGKARHLRKQTQEGVVRIERMEELKQALEEADTAAAGRISLHEYDLLLRDRPDLYKRLEQVGIDVGHTRSLFEILDMERSGSVRYEDFMGAALRLNSVDDAEAKDMYATNLTMANMNEKLSKFEVSMSVALERTSMLLFYVDSKLYRGYSDMVDRSKLEYEKRALSEQRFHMMSKENLLAASNRRPGDAPGNGASVPRYPNVIPRPREEIEEELLDEGQLEML
ncbi:unnamed protein product [Amoebophrya sp. A25]|nr:unnamed protein product [Amoebophrya sp. A25]|eukprot:GSA25T00026140001.1